MDQSELVVGDRVRHLGREQNGTVTSVSNGTVIVLFDNSKSPGYFDELWFQMHGDLLIRCPEQG